MRLLNTRSINLTFFLDSSVPPYAILSHTWGPDEVIFEDIGQEAAETKRGYQKITNCCAKAASDGFDWVWIDTCCIDKSSSSELSEAINSMFQWYKNATTCYAYLEDVVSSSEAWRPGLVLFEQFTESRWFTRGWTLQELIAPRIVEFYSRDWTEIGTKASLQDPISRVTSIPLSVLRGGNPGTCSVAQRMSWAAKRKVTREEDIAYCLLGIFNVNMPMVYGEGERAFLRLQEEIMRRSEDYTILAWSLHFYSTSLTGVLAFNPADFSHRASTEMKVPMRHTHSNELMKIWRLNDRWKDYSDPTSQLFGKPISADDLEEMRAANEKIENSPITKLPYQVLHDKEYDEISCVDPLQQSDGSVKSELLAKDPPQLTSRGLRILLPVKHLDISDNLVLAWIYCFSRGKPVCILLRPVGSSSSLFARVDPSLLLTVEPDELKDFQKTEIYLHPHGFVESDQNHTSGSFERPWGRIKVSFSSEFENRGGTMLSVHPHPSWNLDEIFYDGKPDEICVVIFGSADGTFPTLFAVVVGQLDGIPWCEIYRATTPERHETLNFRATAQSALEAARKRKDPTERSDRSLIVDGNDGLIFSASIRQLPSSSPSISAHALNVSLHRRVDAVPWELMLLEKKKS